MTRMIGFIGILGVVLSLSGFGVAQDTAPVGDTVTIGVVVAVPADTPGDEPVYLSGNTKQLGDWGGKGLLLTHGDDGTYHGSLTLRRGEQVEYKVTRGSWQTVEKNKSGGEIDNRTFMADRDKQVQVTVAGWANEKVARIEPTLTGDIRRHEKFHSDILDNDRTLLVYLPPGYDDQPDQRYPVLYMHDGQNLFDASTSFAGHEWGVDEAAERLITGGKIEPIIIVGVYNNTDRMTEYTPQLKDGEPDAYARFVVEEVKPFIDRTYRTDPSREKTGIAGSSLGGLMSLYMAGAYPQTFGRCGGISPSLWWGDNQLIKRWRSGDTGWMTGTRFWLDIGTAEGPIRPGEVLPSSVANARALAEVFDRAGLKRGVGYQYLEVEGGRHNEQAWSARIQQVLTFLYGR